jgi:hypothetical protein
MLAPKHKSSDAGNSAMPQKSYEVLPLSENVKVPSKKILSWGVKILGKNESSMKLWNVKKNC